MGQREIPPSIMVAVLIAVVAGAAFLLFRGATAGQVSNGPEGKVMASPPMPDAARQQMLHDHNLQPR